MLHTHDLQDTPLSTSVCVKSTTVGFHIRYNYIMLLLVGKFGHSCIQGDDAVMILNPV